MFIRRVRVRTLTQDVCCGWCHEILKCDDISRQSACRVHAVSKKVIYVAIHHLLSSTQPKIYGRVTNLQAPSENWRTQQITQAVCKYSNRTTPAPYHLLSPIPIAYLSVPEIFVPSECVFSTAGDMVGTQSSQLLPESIHLLPPPEI